MTDDDEDDGGRRTAATATTETATTATAIADVDRRVATHDEQGGIVSMTSSVARAAAASWRQCCHVPRSPACPAPAVNEAMARWLSLLLVGAARASADSAASIAGVQKVIGMLQDMSAKGKQEKKDEEVAFAKFDTWCNQAPPMTRDNS